MVNRREFLKMLGVGAALGAATGVRLRAETNENTLVELPGLGSLEENFLHSRAHHEPLPLEEAVEKAVKTAALLVDVSGNTNRAEYAALIHNHVKVRYGVGIPLVLSGGGAGQRIFQNRPFPVEGNSYAEQNARYLKANGIAEKQVFVETQGQDSFLKAVFSYDIVKKLVDEKGVSAIGVVTMDFGLMKAQSCARMVYPELVVYGFATRKKEGEIHEYAVEISQAAGCLALEHDLAQIGIKPGDIESLRRYALTQHPSYARFRGAKPKERDPTSAYEAWMRLDAAGAFNVLNK